MKSPSPTWNTKSAAFTPSHNPGALEREKETRSKKKQEKAQGGERAKKNERKLPSPRRSKNLSSLKITPPPRLWVTRSWEPTVTLTTWYLPRPALPSCPYPLSSWGPVGTESPSSLLSLLLLLDSSSWYFLGFLFFFLLLFLFLLFEELVSYRLFTHGASLLPIRTLTYSWVPSVTLSGNASRLMGYI